MPWSAVAILRGGPNNEYRGLWRATPRQCSQYRRSVQPGEKPDRLGCRGGRSRSKAPVLLP